MLPDAAALSIGFYHLTRSSVEQALPRLLGRTLELGKRALVLVPDPGRAAAIDEALWQAPEPAWLPHGTAALGYPELQPVWITDQPLALNGASFLFLIDGVPAPALEPFARVLDLFDGGAEVSLAAARSRWAQRRQEGRELAYWRQEPDGWRRAG